MYTRTLLAAVAAAALTALATPTLQAQDTTRTTSKGEVAMAPSVTTLMSAIQSASSVPAKLSTLTSLSASDVQLVDVSTLAQGDSAQMVSAAVQQNEASIDSLRTALGSNTTITSALSGNTTPLTTKDVVAADVTSDNKVVLYYWKKSE